MCYSAMVEQNLDYLEDHFGATIVRESFEDYYKLSAQDPKTYKPLKENPRIFPGYFAPIVYAKAGQLYIEPMRYQIWPQSFAQDPKHLSLYNARRDNLDSKFWADSYKKHHGLIVVLGFYEWVRASDLIEAKKISLEDVEAEFARQSLERKERLEALGKNYRPTATEKKPVLERNLIIRFTPKHSSMMLVPTLIAERPIGAGKLLKSFAIITDTPQPEVLAAGHDRQPINLREEAARAFLEPQSLTDQDLERLLGQINRDYYDHAIAEAI